MEEEKIVKTEEEIAERLRGKIKEVYSKDWVDLGGLLLL